MPTGLETGFELDRRWHQLRGEMEQSKKPALYVLARLLADRAVSYAVIGGVALQVRQAEPRTTLDVDVALERLADLPRDALGPAGFALRGSHAHAENWLGPGGVPVQFTDDPAFVEGIRRAGTVPLDDVVLRVLGAADLLHAKLRAAADPARRRSKRIQDLADAQALVEQEPSLRDGLSGSERELLERLPV